MKFIAIYALLLLAGALLLLYTISNRELLNWERLEPTLIEQKVDTQNETVALVVNLHERGQLAKYILSESVALLFVSLFLVTFGSIASIHLILDKLFFRKFYQGPDIAVATRRAVMWSLTPLILLYLAISNLLYFPILITVIAITSGLELVFSMYNSSSESSK